jgi:hypothetical protein
MSERQIPAVVFGSVAVPSGTGVGSSSDSQTGPGSGTGVGSSSADPDSSSLVLPAMSVNGPMLNIIWESYIQSCVKVLKDDNRSTGEKLATLPLAQTIAATKAARAAAMEIVVKRKQASVALANAWQELADKKKQDDRPETLQPWVDAVHEAQAKSQEYPREKVAEVVNHYCSSLANVATLYSIAERGIFDVEQVNDLIFFF